MSLKTTIDPTERVNKIKKLDADLAERMSPNRRAALEAERQSQIQALHRAGFMKDGTPIKIGTR